jgi:hypothetical protein
VTTTKDESMKNRIFSWGATALLGATLALVACGQMGDAQVADLSEEASLSEEAALKAAADAPADHGMNAECRAQLRDMQAQFKAEREAMRQEQAAARAAATAADRKTLGKAQAAARRAMLQAQRAQRQTLRAACVGGGPAAADPNAVVTPPGP